MRIENNIIVLLSSYNGEKYIGQQIESILKQNIKRDIKLLIRDDASNDRTVEIIKQYMNNDNRISLFQGDNIGYIASFFELINGAGEYGYYALSDQDDVWDEDKLLIAIQRIEAENFSGPILYGSTSRLTTEDLNVYEITQRKNKKLTFYNIIIQNILPGHTQVMNNKLINLLRSNIDYSKIYVHDSFITNVAIIFGKVIFDNNPHTNYRQHNNNQVGYGKGYFGWLKERMRRIKKGASKKYSEQIDYICDIFLKYLSLEEQKEMLIYKNSKCNLYKRFNYIIHTKLYRQKVSETILFKILYLLGGYNN